MACREDEMSRTIAVTCPHCQAALKVDADAGVVVSHEPPPPQASERPDFETRLRQMQDDKARAADRMAEAMRREQSKGRIMEDRFRELMEKAKEDKDTGRPVRDIDLD
jgi:hypothetical protein